MNIQFNNRYKPYTGPTLTHKIINQNTMINILSFGAIGDGVTDCYNAFQKAEDSLPSGGEIFVPKGRYRVSQAFFHRSKVTLTGEGAESIILNNTPSEMG